MADPFVAEIRLFAGNFAIRGWAFCDGQLLPISQNTALFSLVGTTFGGDGRTTFGLPNLQGRLAVHPGTGPGLTNRRLGEQGGAETHTLTSVQLAQHTHTNPSCSANDGSSTEPGSNVVATTPGTGTYASGSSTNMANGALTSIGSGGPHNNLQPYTVLNYLIATVGLYPSRS